MELRITDTNSANDSRGRAFGLEGNDFIYVLVAFVGALGFYLLLTALVHLHPGAALCLSLPILVVALAWVLLLRHNKPAGYAEDWFDHLVNPEGWSYAPQGQPQGRPVDSLPEISTATALARAGRLGDRLRNLGKPSS